MVEEAPLVQEPSSFLLQHPAVRVDIVQIAIDREATIATM